MFYDAFPIIIANDTAYAITACLNITSIITFAIDSTFIGTADTAHLRKTFTVSCCACNSGRIIWAGNDGPAVITTGYTANKVLRRDRPAIITAADTAAFVRPGNTAGIIFTYDTANAADTHNISAIYMPFNISAVFNIFDQTVVVTADTANFTAAAIL